jgi:hypothetical protein
MKSKSEEQKAAKVLAEMAKRRLVREGKINEGPLNQLWQGAKGAVSNLGSPIKGAKAGYQGQAGADKNKPIIDRVVKGWSQLAGQIKASGTDPTPEQFKQFVDKQLPGNSIDANQVDITDPNGVFQSISQASQQAAVSKTLGPASSPTPTPAATTPTAAPASAPASAPAASPTSSPAAPTGDAFKQVQQLIRKLTPKQKAAIAKQLSSATAAPTAAPASTPAPTPASTPATPTAPSPAGLDPAVVTDIVSALTGMGYTKQDAQSKASALPPGTTTEDGLRQIISGRPAAAPAAAPAPAAPNLGPTVTNSSKENKKPSIAEMKKLKSKLVVKEMALAKLKRDKGII